MGNEEALLDVEGARFSLGSSSDLAGPPASLGPIPEDADAAQPGSVPPLDVRASCGGLLP